MSRPIPRPAPVTKATLDSDMPRILACAGVEGNHRAWPAILLTVGVGIGQVIAWRVRGAPQQRDHGPVLLQHESGENTTIRNHRDCGGRGRVALYCTDDVRAVG